MCCMRVDYWREMGYGISVLEEMCAVAKLEAHLCIDLMIVSVRKDTEWPRVHPCII